MHVTCRYMAELAVCVREQVALAVECNVCNVRDARNVLPFAYGNRLSSRSNVSPESSEATTCGGIGGACGGVSGGIGGGAGVAAAAFAASARGSACTARCSLPQGPPLRSDGDPQA